MPVQTEYSQETELDSALAKTLADTPGLQNVNDHAKVGACFMIRTNENEENVPSKGEKVALKKITPLMKAFFKPKFDFIVVVDYYFWTNATESEKQGKFIRALSRIGIDNTENGVKLSIRPWDIQENILAIRACGVFDDMGSRAKEAYDRTRAQRETTEAMLENRQKQQEEQKETPLKAEPPKDEPKSKAKGRKNGGDDEPPLRPARRPAPEPREPEPEPEPE